MKSVVRTLAAATAIGGVAGQIGTPWACPQQPGPFSAWINEWHVIGQGTTDETREVEVAAVSAAGVNYNSVDIAILDAQGNRLATRNIGTTCAVTRAAPGAPPGALDFIVCGNWQGALAVSML